MDEETPPTPAKPSQVPSWVTLGFVLGALFVLAWPRRDTEAPAERPAENAAAPTPAKVAAAPKMATIDAVFESWGGGAVWSDGTTEVALWSPETKSYSDFYEVVRVDGEFYYRPIPALTRPIVTRGVPENSPLEFTETERQRQEWLGEVQKENWKAFMGNAGQPSGPPLGKRPSGP
ncbi:MAG TPA: hypothetical protein VN877_02055 [Opitutaceae bacterium]|nr:hypothetical protein [Opitutaceae bacterium]